MHHAWTARRARMFCFCRSWVFLQIPRNLHGKILLFSILVRAVHRILASLCNFQTPCGDGCVFGLCAWLVPFVSCPAPSPSFDCFAARARPRVVALSALSRPLKQWTLLASPLSQALTKKFGDRIHQSDNDSFFPREDKFCYANQNSFDQNNRIHEVVFA